MRHDRSLAPKLENGSILLVALVILVALSFLGLMALNDTDFELKLSRNDKVITRIKAHTTAVALTAAQRIENLNEHTLDDADLYSTTRLFWLTNGRGIDQFDHTQWFTKENINALGLTEQPNSATFEADDGLTNPSAGVEFNEKFQNSELQQNCEFQAIDMGIKGGNSLAIGNNTTNVHAYNVAAYCMDGPQFRIIQLGYRKKH